MTESEGDLRAEAIRLYAEAIRLYQEEIRRLEQASAARNREAMLQLERNMVDKFRELREERGWSQTDLSRELEKWGFNLHQTTIAKIELGKRPLRVAEMFALSHVFRMPPGAVFFMVRANRDEVDGFDHLADLIGREEERLRDQREQWTKVLQHLVDVTVEHEWRRTHLISLMRSLAAGQEPDSRAIEWLADHDDRRRDSEQQHPASVTPDRALAHLGLEPASPDHAPQPLEVDHG